MGFFGGGGGSSVDLASPGPIGSTTPSTGAFTTLSATPPANTTPLTSTGYSLTGSNAQTLFNLSGTWNTTGTPTAIFLNVTDTASNSASKLIDLQVGGSSKASIDKTGLALFTLAGSRSAPTIQVRNTNSGIYSPASNWLGFAVAGVSPVQIDSTGILLGSGTGFGWTNQVNDPSQTGTRDLTLARDSADILAQRRTTNAQTFRLYRTFTDASNYERLGFLATNTTRYTITSQNAGTGSARSLEISFYTSASDPTSTDITDGCFSVWKNSGTGTIKLWANDGGTMKSVSLA